jgi:hypothetical protein
MTTDANPYSVIGRSGGVVQLPAGIVRTSSPLNFFGCVGTVLQGHPDGTVIVYAGPPVQAVIDMRGTNRCTLRNLEIQVRTPGCYAAVMVSSLPYTGGMANPSACLFETVVVNNWDGGNTNTQVGFSVGPVKRAEADHNNDWHRFAGCRVIGYDYAAFRVNGGQAHNLEFDSCDAMNYSRTGKYGWAWDYGCFARMHRCGFYGHREADIYLDGNAIGLFVAGHDSEGSAALLHTGSSASSFPVRFADLCRGSFAGTGKPIVHFRHAGPLSFSDCLWEMGTREGGIPQVAMDNRAGVVRIEWTAFLCQVDPVGKAVVLPWGKEVDSKSDACTMTWIKGDDQLAYKVPADPTKAVK